MQARLTFAVATCVDPDILILDEALSVGDARFQLKSFDRIRDFKRRGKSILLVSHGINQVVSICDRAILLEEGKIRADGQPNKVGQVYHELLFGRPSAAREPLPTEDDAAEGAAPPHSPQARTPTGAAEDTLDAAKVDGGAQAYRYGNGWAAIRSVRVEDRSGQVPSAVRSGGTYRLVTEFVARQPLPSVCVSFNIKNTWGLDLIGTDTRFLLCEGLPDTMKPRERCRVSIELPIWLAPGTYFVTISIVGTDETKYDHWFDCLSFTVAPTPVQLYHSSLLNVPIAARAELSESDAEPAAPGRARAGAAS
jgi:lipopolysaccharide transport system ATP-binding protein